MRWLVRQRALGPAHSAALVPWVLGEATPLQQRLLLLQQPHQGAVQQHPAPQPPNLPLLALVDSAWAVVVVALQLQLHQHLQGKQEQQRQHQLHLRLLLRQHRPGGH